MSRAFLHKIHLLTIRAVIHSHALSFFLAWKLYLRKLLLILNPGLVDQFHMWRTTWEQNESIWPKNSNKLKLSRVMLAGLSFRIQ